MRPEMLSTRRAPVFVVLRPRSGEELAPSIDMTVRVERALFSGGNRDVPDGPL